MSGQSKLYTSLASWWPLVSAPDEYEEEAGIYREQLESVTSGPIESVLELGSGGGNNAWHLKKHFRMTLVDLSPEMLDVSRRLNRECDHIQGDMRSVRLNKTFDAVFVHDAVTYMVTEEDLRAAMQTAYAHCRPGGGVLFAPDHVSDTFESTVDHGGRDGDDRAVRYLEWTWDPDPADTSHVVDYAFLLRLEDGRTIVEHDRHVNGLFPISTWLQTLSAVGFEARSVPFEHTELDDPTTIFVGTRPELRPAATD